MIASRPFILTAVAAIGLLAGAAALAQTSRGTAPRPQPVPAPWQQSPGETEAAPPGSPYVTTPAARDPLRTRTQPSWEKDYQRLYGAPPMPRGTAANPTGQQPARGRSDDPALRLGLPPNKPMPEPEPTPRGAGPTPQQVSRFATIDTNRDGFVSPEEYLDSLRGNAPAGAAGLPQRQALQAKAQSRFRGADLNRDGKIDLKEFGVVRDPRF